MGFHFFRTSNKNKARLNRKGRPSSKNTADIQQNELALVVSRPVCEPSAPVTTDDLWVLAERRLGQDKSKQELFTKATLILQESGLVIGKDGIDGRQLCDFLDDRANELEEKKWVIGDQKVSVRDKIIAVIKNILVLKDVVSTAASTSPPAAIACGAVTLSLVVSPFRPYQSNDSCLSLIAS
jgi:hypothetical protein